MIFFFTVDFAAIGILLLILIAFVGFSLDEIADFIISNIVIFTIISILLFILISFIYYKYIKKEDKSIETKRDLSTFLINGPFGIPFTCSRYRKIRKRMCRNRRLFCQNILCCNCFFLVVFQCCFHRRMLHRNAVSYR